MTQSLRPASKTIVSLLRDWLRRLQRTLHYTRLFNHQRNNIYSMYNWCKHQINRTEHIKIMQVTFASVTEDAPWAEPRTTVRVRNNDVSALTAARCFLRVSRLRPLPLAPVTHRFHPGGMLAQGTRITLHLTYMNYFYNFFYNYLQLFTTTCSKF